MNKKLIFFDLDGTLLTGMEYSWQHLWKYFAIDPSLTKPLARQYFAGQISYEAWVTACCDLLIARKMNYSLLTEAFTEITPTEGAKEILHYFKDQGHRLFVISGGINIAVDVALPEEKILFDQIFINHFNFDDSGKLISATPTPYDGDHKATCIQDMMAKYDIISKDTVFIGDNDNDVAAARIAGISIAFNSKSKQLNSIATHTAKTNDLREIIALIES